jgi:membrane associated rhomboid family serine protease
MLPIKDDQPRASAPFITYFLIALNVFVFLFERNLGPREYKAFVSTFALVPQQVISWKGGSLPAAHAFFPLLSSMFLHAGWMHVIFNMWGLAIFGDNVEDRLGHFKYLVFYLACGLGAGVTHLVFNFGSRVPTVGASGAIAGVMGAYFLLFPGARVLTWWGFFVFWLPAWLVLGYWFVVNFLSGAATSFAAGTDGAGGVAFWAHVGGFLSGVVLIKLMAPRRNVYAFEDY